MIRLFSIRSEVGYNTYCSSDLTPVGDTNSMRFRVCCMVLELSRSSDSKLVSFSKNGSDKLRISSLSRREIPLISCTAHKKASDTVSSNVVTIHAAPFRLSSRSVSYTHLDTGCAEIIVADIREIKRYGILEIFESAYLK